MPILEAISIGDGKTKSMVTEYGSITEAQVKAHAAIYQKEDNRKRQAASMLEALVANSLEPDVYDELEQREDKYTIDVVPTGGTDSVSRIDGVMIFYQLIQMVCVDTKATVSNILDLLSRAGLVQAMADAESDIQLFNRKVNGLIASLKSRQAGIPHLIAPLFKAYQKCEDKAFAQYFARKEELYEDGSLIGLKYSVLMRMASERYKIIKDKGEWKPETKEELDFMALTAKLEERHKKQLTQQPIQGQRQGGRDRQGPNNTGEWAWKGVAPKEGEPVEKKFRGKQYIYCPHHGSTKWVLKINRQGVVHATNCRARQKEEKPKIAMSATTDEGSTTEGSDYTPTKKELLMAQALAAVIEGDDWPDTPEDEELHTSKRG
ncbi:hypothetical protein SEMRO_1466_G275020.1 [Seminavis robusta]|uniref:Uncharacterized protein n=1 Tax=Seminavis robusta TaxID=568900 RepID=A0A9N8HT47_9STRA|nr:hypothetical protein SEMRO_1466_G275020.1 [Seminavis robusta]|eukprot:Sro1466_g275020.1 n/a (377) ;mRNA; r:6499-7629